MNPLGLYILDAQGRPVPEPDTMKWADWFEKNYRNRHVKDEMVGTIRVSTVFLGIDYSFPKTSGPILWETMVFGGSLHNQMLRCSGPREQAEAMHAEMVALVQAEPAAAAPLIRELFIQRSKK